MERGAGRKEIFEEVKTLGEERICTNGLGAGLGPRIRVRGAGGERTLPSRSLTAGAPLRAQFSLARAIRAAAVRAARGGHRVLAEAAMAVIGDVITSSRGWIAAAPGRSCPSRAPQQLNKGRAHCVGSVARMRPPVPPRAPYRIGI